MSEFFIYIIIGLIAYLLLKKKNNNKNLTENEVEKKNYKVLYSLENTEPVSNKAKIPEERKLLYKKAGFEIPKYKHSYVKHYSYDPGAKTINYNVKNDKTKIDFLVKDLIQEINSGVTVRKEILVCGGIYFKSLALAFSNSSLDIAPDFCNSLNSFN